MGVDHTTLGPSYGAVFPRAAPCLRALTPTGAPLKLQDLILALPRFGKELSQPRAYVKSSHACLGSRMYSCCLRERRRLR